MAPLWLSVTVLLAIISPGMGSSIDVASMRGMELEAEVTQRSQSSNAGCTGDIFACKWYFTSSDDNYRFLSTDD